MMLSLCVSVAAARTTPHVLYIMADDLGWHNVGYHNPNMTTPNLNALVKDGIELDRTYAYHYCSPTRSSLLTGRLPIHVNQLTAVPGGAAHINGTTYPASMADARMTMLPKKLAAAGYVSYQVGKWHAGDLSAELLPVQRGFNHSFGYLGGAEDHFKQTNGQGVDLWRDNQPAYGANGTTYGTLLWTTEAVERISQHKSNHGDSPMFMYLAYANCHCPLEVPDSYQDKSIDTKLRRIYHGMAHALDEGIGNVTTALKSAGMWEDTWIFFTSDNGAPIHDPASGCSNEDPKQPGLTGGNNWPLRGGKVSDFEGGVRVNAFVTGGIRVLASGRRGTKLEGTIAIADLHATICAIAGVSIADSGKSTKSGAVPAVDGVSMLPYLTGAVATSPRTELPLSCLSRFTVYPGDSTDAADADIWQGGALIIGNHKIVYGTQIGMGLHTGPVYPNATSTVPTAPWGPHNMRLPLGKQCGPPPAYGPGPGPTPTPGPGPGPKPPTPSAKCATELLKDCPKPWTSVKACEKCAEGHTADLQAAGCDGPGVKALCQKGAGALDFIESVGGGREEQGDYGLDGLVVEAIPSVTKPCLFDIRADPSESNDLMDDPSPSPEVKQLLAMMEKKYKEHCSTFFQSTHIFADEQHNEHQKCTSTEQYIDTHKGFEGPTCT